MSAVWLAVKLMMIPLSTISLGLGDYLFFLMLPISLAGGLCNNWAKALNGGQMPIAMYPVEYYAAGFTRLSLMTAESRVPMLCDVIPVPGGYCSVGDILLWAGFLLMGVYGAGMLLACLANQ